MSSSLLGEVGKELGANIVILKTSTLNANLIIKMSRISFITCGPNSFDYDVALPSRMLKYTRVSL